MTPPRDLADAQARLDQLQGYLDQFADALAARDAKLDKVRDFARGQREMAAELRAINRPYDALPYDNTAAALERIIGGKQW